MIIEADGGPVRGHVMRKAEAHFGNRMSSCYNTSGLRSLLGPFDPDSLDLAAFTVKMVRTPTLRGSLRLTHSLWDSSPFIIEFTYIGKP